MFESLGEWSTHLSQYPGHVWSRTTLNEQEIALVNTLIQKNTQKEIQPMNDILDNPHVQYIIHHIQNRVHDCLSESFGNLERTGYVLEGVPTYIDHIISAIGTDLSTLFFSNEPSLHEEETEND